MQTILISLPVFLVIFLGWFFSKVKIADKNWTHFLNGFAYYVALPALIISSFIEINFLNKGTWFLILESISIVVIFAIVVFCILSLFKIDKITKTTILLGSIVGNTVFIGFPLVGMNFGNAYISQASLVGSFLLIIPIILVIIFIQSEHCTGNACYKKEFLGLLKNPLLLSIIFGILLSFVKKEFGMIESIEKTVAMLGATASPVALFALGTFMHGQSKKYLSWSLFISVLKMIVLPIIAVLISIFIFKNNDIRVLALLSAMPVAVTTFVIAEKFELNKELIGDSILISTILSFIIAPLVIYFFI